MEILLWTVLGFALVIVDILVIPGSFLVVVGSGAILYSIFLNYQEYGLVAAGIHLLICLATVPKLVSWGFGRLAHQGEMRGEDGYIGVDDHARFVGMHGVARSDLRPSGSVAVVVDEEEEYLDCISEGDFIGQGEAVVIVEDRGTSLVVRPAKEIEGSAHVEA